MERIHDRDIYLQILGTKTGFRTRALPLPAGEVSGAGRSPFVGLEWKSYRGFIASALA